MTYPGYLLNRQAEAHAIREEVGAPNLKVQMDLYHAQIVEGDLAEKFRRWLPHIGHVQIAGVPGRHEPDVGEINYGYLFKLLDDLRYDGWVGCEYRPAASTTAGLAWLYRLLDRARPAGQDIVERNLDLGYERGRSAHIHPHFVLQRGRVGAMQRFPTAPPTSRRR